MEIAQHHRHMRASKKLGCLLLLACVTEGCAFLYPAIIDDSTAHDATIVGDAGMSADVEALKNKPIAPGTGEFQSAMCLQQYVRARAAAVALANAKDDYGQRLARSEMMGGFATCAQTCKLAAEQMPSAFSPMAAKYQPRCVSGASGTEEEIETAHLERLVANYRDATQPLGLFFADQDAAALLDHLQKRNMSNPTIESLESEVKSMRAANTPAIAKGRAFFESPAASENFLQRSSNENEQQSIKKKINRLGDEREEAKRSGLPRRVESLDAEIADLQVILKTKIVEHERLKEKYEAMAEQAGVYRRP
jgi:hypothetical protein